MTGRMYMIKAGTKPTLCGGHLLEGGSCRQEIYWYRETLRGRQVSTPVDCSGGDCQKPSDTADATQGDIFSGVAKVHEGFGYRHVCPDAKLFAQRAQAREGQRA